MNYELAKQLKDAGWNYFSAGEWLNDQGFTVSPEMGNAYVPTLEELIEACGEKVAVFHDGTMWTAGKIAAMPLNGLLFFDAVFSRAVLAATPTEAVAKLWLVLKER